MSARFEMYSSEAAFYINTYDQVYCRMLRYVTLSYITLHYAMLHYVILCHVKIIEAQQSTTTEDQITSSEINDVCACTYLIN